MLLVVSAVKENYPIAKIKVTPPYETEDVDIKIYVPEEIELEVLDFATDLTYKIEMNEGYDIVTMVMPIESLKEGVLP